MKLAWLVWLKDFDDVVSQCPVLWPYPPDEDQWDVVKSMPIAFQELEIPSYV